MQRPVRVHIPTPLRGFSGGQSTVEATGRTVAEVLSAVVGRFPDIRPHLFAENGRLRSFVNLYVNDEDIRYLDREETSVNPGDELSIVPSIAGG